MKFPASPGRARGRIAKVEVSADGGRSWADAALQEPVLAKALTRFRLAWRWDGGPAVLQSRAVDEAGNAQPTREALLARRGTRALYHFNAIASWGVAPGGKVSHVYAWTNRAGAAARRLRGARAPKGRGSDVPRRLTRSRASTSASAPTASVCRPVGNAARGTPRL